ncbi:MAG: hypothetical protein A2086_04465 [Spirochaetes bacterium GWD1_27_9]|nr:MAG: hypothetical protein A2086_04465 [Spirochaetes bacterium GWD1_27_9]
MEKNINKRLKKIKQFGYSFALGMLILFLISLWKNFILPVKGVIIFLSVYHLLCALFFYKGLYPTFHLMNFIGKIVGNFLTYIVFTVVFYVFVSPISFILRLAGKDHIKNYSTKPQWLTVKDEENNPKRVEKLY